MLSGCGGQIESSNDAAPPANESKSDAGDHGGSAEQLGECKLGPSFDQYPNIACEWLGAGHCYATKKDACNCVCPRDHDSVCWSEFPTGSSPTPVYCD